MFAGSVLCRSGHHHLPRVAANASQLVESKKQIVQALPFGEYPEKSKAAHRIGSSLQGRAEPRQAVVNDRQFLLWIACFNARVAYGSGHTNDSSQAVPGAPAHQPLAPRKDETGLGMVVKRADRKAARHESDQ